MSGTSTDCEFGSGGRDQSRRCWWHADVELVGDHVRWCRDLAGIHEEIEPIKDLGVHHPD